MGFSQKAKVSESENGTVENAALISLQSEFDNYKRQCSLQKQRLFEEKEYAFASLKEFLLNQAREVKQVQNKVAGMKARVVAMENGNEGESDILARLNLVEQSLVDLCKKYNERARLVENNTQRVTAECGSEELEVLSRQDIDPKVLRSEIATLQNLQVIVSNFYSQLFDSKNEADYQHEVATAYEKLANAEKQKAATQQAITALRAEFEEQLAAVASEKKRVLAEKEDSFASLKQVILLQLRDAQTVSSKLAQLKEKMGTDDEFESAGFSEMKVRIKLTETALLALLKDHEEKGKIIEEARAALKDGTFSGDVTESINFSASFAKVRRLREVLGYLHGQLKATEALLEEKNEALVKKMRSENAAYQKELSDLRRLAADGKERHLQEKENSCDCMKEVIQMKKKAAEQLRAQLSQIQERSGSGGELSDCASKTGVVSGLNEMETRLKLVEQALSQMGDSYEEAAKQLASYRARAQKEEMTAVYPDVPDFRTSYGKVQHLGRILAILSAQLNATGVEAVVQKKVLEEKKAASDKLNAMRKHFQDEKEVAFACLTEVIALKQGEAHLVRSKINKLKERNNVGVEEMESRLKCVDDALGNLHVECEEAVKAIAEENECCFEEGNGEVKPSSAKKSLAKLNQLRGIMCFLRAQLNAAMFEDDDRRPFRREKVAAEQLIATREQLLEEKENACACLLGVIEEQESKARLVRWKINSLKEQNPNIDIDEMDARLRLVEGAIDGLRARSEETIIEIYMERTTEAQQVNLTNSRDSLAKIDRLRGLLYFLNSMLDEAMASEANKHPSKKTSAEKISDEKLVVMRQKFINEKRTACSCLMKIISDQKNEARLIRSKIEKLKESNVDVSEMEMRLKLVEGALVDLDSSCNGAVKDKVGAQNIDDEKPANAEDSLAKLNHLQGILSFLTSMLDAAIAAEASKRPPQKTSAEKIAEQKLIEMQQKFLREKQGACSCLMIVISVQENEARLVRSKIEKLKEGEVDVSEMETRLKLVEGALVDLHSTCGGAMKETVGQNAIAHGFEPANAQESLAKLNRLQGILSFLNSMLDAAIAAEASKRPPQKTSAEKIADQKLIGMQHRFLSEKQGACSCLMSVISVQENEARLVRSKIEKLKDGEVDVSEMETRLKLVEGALVDLHSTCEEAMKETVGQNAIAHGFEPANAQESLAKLNRLQGILSFLNSMLDAAIAAEASKRPPQKTSTEKIADQKLIEMQQKLLREKQGTCSCLMSVISVQENEARLVRSKIEKLKEGEVDVSEMETRLKLVEGALVDLHSTCEGAMKETVGQNAAAHGVELTNAQESLAKLNRLQGILSFLNSMLDAAIAAKASKRPPPKSSAEKIADQKLIEMQQKFLREKQGACSCLMSVISVQENEARLVRSKIGKLKEGEVDVSEMETRLKLVEGALVDLHSTCEGAMKATVGENAIAHGFEPAHAQESLAKLNRLQGILSFLNSMLDAAIAVEASKRLPQKTPTEKIADQKLIEMQQKFLSEKQGACSCLVSVISVQAKKALRVRSKIEKLKEGEVDVSEMETRLKLVEGAVVDLHSTCEEAMKATAGQNAAVHCVEPTNARESLAKLNKLQGILSFLNSMLDAAIAAKASKRPPQKTLAEKIAHQKLIEMQQKFVREKQGACSCLMSVISVQENEARLVRSKIEKLKDGEVDVSEMETRLKLVEGALVNLHSTCEGAMKETVGENAIAHGSEPANAQESLAKLNRLQGILSFLNSMLDAAIASGASKRPPQKTSAEKIADQKLIEMQQRFLSEKQGACSCLMSVINVQENEARLVRSKIEKLKEGEVDVSEMETRLKLVQGALVDLHSTCEGAMKATVGENAIAHGFEPAHAQESLAKLNRLQGILSFLNSMLDAAIASGASKRPPQKTSAEKIADQKLIEMQQKFLREKQGTCSCLMSVISAQENEARLVRFKIEKLKEGNVDVSEMETRLKLVEGALVDLHSTCEGAMKETVGQNAIAHGFEPANAQESLAKLNRLQGILSFLNSMMDAAIAAKVSKRPSRKTLAEKVAHEKFEEMKLRFLKEKDSACAALVEVVRAQEDEARLVRLKVDRLKEGNAGVAEMDTRLRLAEVALRDIRMECEVAIKMVSSQLCSDHGGDCHSMKPTEARTSLAKINRLREILSSLYAQLHTAMLEDERSRKKPSPPKIHSTTESEKKSIRDCLSTIISIQKEAEDVRSKVTFLSSKTSVGINEMETRLGLAEASLCSLRSEFEAAVSKVDEIKGVCPPKDHKTIMTTSDVQKGIAKVKQLQGIIGFLSAQINAAIPEEHWRDQKERVSDFLAGILSVQQAAEVVKAKVKDLKERSFGVEEMETRLKLAGAALEALHLEAEKNSCFDVDKGMAKLNQLRGVLGFLHAQVTAAMPKQEVESRPKKEVVEQTVVRKSGDVTWQQFLEEKGNTCTCLLELIGILEKEAQLVRSKVSTLMENGCLGGVEEMETRLKLAEVTLGRLRTETTSMMKATNDDGATTDAPFVGEAIAAKTSNAIQILGKVNQLRSIIGFLDAQLNAVLTTTSGDNKKRQAPLPPPPKKIQTEDNSALIMAKEKSLATAQEDHHVYKKMNELLGFQYQEMVRLRAAVERRHSFVWTSIAFLTRAMFYGSLILGIIYVIRGWETSMTPFNLVCSPALPGTRITEHSGVHAAPFWVPQYFKDTVYEKVCSDVPRIRLEVKDHNFVVTEMESGDKAMKLDKNGRRSGGWAFGWERMRQIVPVEKIRRYPARVAYVTLSNILTVDSDGWHEVPLPWATVKDQQHHDEDGSSRLWSHRSRR
ncbi:hypothetical protein ACA910_022587 [Epithemia clementina (nom. ined.)]